MHGCCGERIAPDCRVALTVKWTGRGNVYVAFGECSLLNFSVKRMGAKYSVGLGNGSVLPFAM